MHPIKLLCDMHQDSRYNHVQHYRVQTMHKMVRGSWPSMTSRTSQSLGQSRSHAMDRRPVEFHQPPRYRPRTTDLLRNTRNVHQVTILFPITIKSLSSQTYTGHSVRAVISHCLVLFFIVERNGSINQPINQSSTHFGEWNTNSAAGVVERYFF